MKKRIKRSIITMLLVSLLVTPCTAQRSEAAKVQKRKLTMVCGKKKTLMKWNIGKVKKYQVTYSRKNIAVVKVKKTGQRTQTVLLKGTHAGKVNITIRLTNKEKRVTTYRYQVTVKAKQKSTEEEEIEDTLPPRQTKMPLPTKMPGPLPPAASVPPAVPTEEPYQSKYTYDIEILNPGTLYTDSLIAFYIKTDNPNVDKLGAYALEEKSGIVFGGGGYVSKGHFDDVNYIDEGNISYDGVKVEGGYFVPIVCDSIGEQWDDEVCDFVTKTFSGGEVELIVQEDDGKQWHDVASLKFTVENWDDACKQWMQQVVEDNTTSDMTIKEKMDAIRNYFYTEYSYSYNDGKHMLRFLSDAMLPLWESKHMDCWTATSVMIEFAHYFGLQAEATDGSNEPGAGALHRYATVYIDGVAYRYDASPSSATGVITEWDYIL